MNSTVGYLKIVRATLGAVTKDIAANTNLGDKYSRGLAAEGYAGGYAQALRDVLLLMESGTLPNTRHYWPDSTEEAQRIARRRVGTPKMTIDKEQNVKQLLLQARNEILDLRRRNEILAAQMGVVEVFAAALGLKRNEVGMAPDVAWSLLKAAESMETPRRWKPFAPMRSV
jgi:hypothetical protein